MDGSPVTPPDRYTRVRRLGRGGSGTVWLVRDALRPGAGLALKELAESSRGREDGLRREFATLASLRHPNLVEVHEFDVDPASGLPRFTMEYVEGRDLVAAVSAGGPSAFDRLAAEALRALAFLHDFAVVHRDLKPANLLARDEPRLGCRLAVLDFGLAVRTALDGSVAAEGLSGTLPYLAPELLEGAEAGPRSDLYALGAVLFEALHGRAAFVLEDGDDLAEFLDAIRRGARPRLEPPAAYPAGLTGWLDEMLSRDPDLRPGNAAEALARFNRHCGTRHPLDTNESRRARLASGSPPGRDEEIGRLWRHLERRGGPGLVWLCGAPGSGKTRALRWLRSDGAARGWEVVVPPPWSRLAERDAGAVAGLQLEELLRRVPGPGSAGTLLLLDEIENAEGTLLEFLDRFARGSDANRLRIVAALRPGEAHHPVLRRLVEDTATVPALERIDLDPLGADGLRAMIVRAGGSRTISASRVAWLAKASEGSAFVAEGLLVEGARKGVARAPRHVALERAVAGKVERISTRARGWLEALSLLGAGTPESLVSDLAGIDAAAGDRAASELFAAGLARREEIFWSPDSRAVAAHVAGSIAPARRRAMHARAARLLEDTVFGAADPWRRAEHHAGAGDAERALELAVAAAEQAEREADPSVAADRYAFALRRLGRRRDPRRLALRRKQGEALAAAARPADAVRAFAAALRLVDGDRKRAELLVAQSAALAVVGRAEAAHRAALEARDLARRCGAALIEGRAAKTLGMALVRTNRETEAVEAFRRAVNDLRAEAKPRELVECLHYLAWVESRLLVPSAEEHFAEALELCRLHGDGRGELNVLLSLAQHHRNQGRPDEALGLIVEVSKLAEQLADPLAIRRAVHERTLLAFGQGEYDRAISWALELEDHALRHGDASRVVAGRALRGEALMLCGHVAEATELLEATLASNLDRVEPRRVDFARLTCAEALLQSPGCDQRRLQALLDEAVGNCRARNDDLGLWRALVIETERRLGERNLQQAQARIAELEQLGPGQPDLLGAEYLVRLQTARARRWRQLGELEKARRSALEAAELSQERNLPEHAATALSLASEVLEDQGNLDEAVHALGRGRELLEAAAQRIEDAELRRDFLARPLFRRLRDPGVLGVNSTDDRVMALYGMIHALNSEGDPEQLLESILDRALGVVRAERGMILLVSTESGDLTVRLARNLERETIEDVEEFSRTVVARAGAGEPILALDTGQDARFRTLKSVSMFGIRSLMCVPLRSRGRITGTVYLDSRNQSALFTHEDLQFLEAFADHAALALENARTRAWLRRDIDRLREVVKRRARFDNIIGESPAMRQVFDLIEKVAASDFPVLIQGESGTGKELVANAIHFNSGRRAKTLLSESCAAIPESLLESELFGHVRGAFTGAERDRTGLFEQADGGTLFLDEVGDMSPAMQARLLRVLEEGELRPVGGDRPIKVDVRMLAASHKNLQQEVDAGRFREDLFYRLQVLLIEIPPLRDRVGDLPLLVEHFLAQISRERGQDARAVEPRVMELFERYSWPGNVRQLQNVMRRLSLLAGGGAIDRSLVEADAELRRMLVSDADLSEPVFSLERNEREAIRTALVKSNGNRNRAAGLLGVSRATIYRKIKEYRL